MRGNTHVQTTTGGAEHNSFPRPNQDDILYINAEDVPTFKKGGAVVRNSYFWALKSISCYSSRGRDWEFDRPVWVALGRMLTSFTQSGYLGDTETCLEFEFGNVIPEELRNVATFE